TSAPARRSHTHCGGVVAAHRGRGAGEPPGAACPERGGEGPKYPLLPPGDIDPAGQYHDRGTAVGAAAAPGDDRRRRVRAADAATPAAANESAGAPAVERRTRARGAGATGSRAVTAPIF